MCPENRVKLLLHPYRDEECELVRELHRSGSVARLFVVVWSPQDMVKRWLDGVGAVNLHTGSVVNAPDPAQLEAARCWVDEQYNGLASGNGKSAVVQLLRVFSDAGYELTADTWLQAFFAAGGDFDEAESVAKLIRELKNGVRHRIKDRYRPEILDVLRARTAG